MSRTWFTSDQHFYHRNVIKYCGRPFTWNVNKLYADLMGAPPNEQAINEAVDKDVDEMNAEMVRRHNAVVQPGDIVYHLGDFSLSHRAVEVFLPQLNGDHYLIAGNHDHCHPAHYKKKLEKGERMKQLYLDAGFKSIKLQDTIELEPGLVVLMHHMPYANPDYDKVDGRYAAIRPIDKGSFLLHGHIHQHWHKKGRMLNVGVDRNNFTPVSLERIIELLKTEGDIL